MTSSDSSGGLQGPGAGRGRRRAGLAMVALAGSWALAACGTSPPKPTRVEGSISAASALNPSINNRPSPLLLR